MAQYFLFSFIKITWEEKKFMNNELFENSPIPKTHLKLSLPVVMSSVLTLVYNMVDTYFVAQTGNTNLVAGVSICAPIFTLLVALGDILGLGGSSMMSRLFGAGKEEDAKRMSVFCLWGSVILGIVMALILMLGQNVVLSLLGANNDTMEYARSYFVWIACGAPFVIFSLTPTNLLRTEGLAAQAMVGSILGSIVNIILDPIFIFTLGMGAAGAAAATIIGNVCADIFYVYVICNKTKMVSLNLKGFHISAEEVKAVLQIGIPSSITNLMASIATAILNNFLVVYGNTAVATMGIVTKVTMVVVMIMVGFSFGGQPLYGYLYGAKKFKRLKDSYHFALKIVVGLAIVMSLVIAIFAPMIMSCFLKDETVIHAGATMLRIILCGEPFIGITMVITCLFQSTGKAIGALALSAGRQGYIYIVVMFLLNALFQYYGVISAQPVSDILTSILAIVLLKKLLLKEFETQE